MTPAIDYSKYDTFLITREDRLLTVTFNNPEALNGFRPGQHEQLEEFFHEVAGDESVGAIIVTAEGERAFCVGGASLRKGASNPEPRKSTQRSLVGPKRLIANMLNCEQPIIAAVNGDAIGVGASLAFACDILVCSERARFADTHVKNLGVAAGDGGTVMWPLMMGIHKAKEHLLTGKFLYANEAEALGIVNYAVPPGDVLPKAREIAIRLANGPTWAIRYTKNAVNKILLDRLNLTMDAALTGEWLNFASEDHKEAVQAWMEKREPKFQFR